jgi:hypothetical protein
MPKNPQAAEERPNRGPWLGDLPARSGERHG